jgi:hypothetical protein
VSAQVDPHHRKRRSQGGDDSYGNVIDIPRELHDLIHAHPEVAYEHGLLVKSHDEPGEIRPDVPGFLASIGVEWQEGKTKRPRLKGEARASRKTISVRLPEGVSGEEWDELFADAVKTELEQPDTKFDPSLGDITIGKLVVAVFERFVGRASS